jgi:dihydrofolate reductase
MEAETDSLYYKIDGALLYQKKTMSHLTIIVAATKSNGIGQSGKLPWRLSKEMAYFARVTSSAPEERRNAVIMGRKTWESIPAKFKPLPKRFNVVVSHNGDYELYVCFSTLFSVILLI